MQSHHACGNLTALNPRFRLDLRRRFAPLRWPPFPPPRVSIPLRVSCDDTSGGRRGDGDGDRRAEVKARKKDDVWSVDTDLAAKASSSSSAAAYVNSHGPSRYRRERSWRGKDEGKEARDLVSGPMLVEIEAVLQTEEPVIKPAWDTFAGGVSGIWKGVGAVFSPFTGEIEPIEVGDQNENLYDCYALSRIERVDDDAYGSRIRRRTQWAALNPFGETLKHRGDRSNSNKENLEEVDVPDASCDLPTYESFDFIKSDVMEEDYMGMEPGLIFFEDGSYSRGPVDIPVGEAHASDYFISPTLKFEQCLVKGGHERLRIVHSIKFSEGGSSIQIVRVAIYDEEWSGPTCIEYKDDRLFHLELISQRKRTEPTNLTGFWKVFEVSATPLFNEETTDEGSLPFAYSCSETLKKRSLPGNSLDMQDATILWLPDGVTGYVDVNKEGILTIGVSWYSDGGINLVMERDYGMDGKLKEVRSKTELQRRWAEPCSSDTN